MVISREKWALTMARALMKGYFLGCREERKRLLSSGHLVRKRSRRDLGQLRVSSLRLAELLRS